MGKPLRVLVVEDSQPDAQLLLYELRQSGYEPTYALVSSAEEMNQALDKQEWDIVLADYVMPSFSGLAALELLRARGIDLPFIIVSGQIGEDIAVAAMKAGANDYIMKGDLTRLVPAVEKELGDARVRWERRRAEEERVALMEQLRVVNEQLVVSSLSIKEQADDASVQAAALDAVGETIAEGLVFYDADGKIVRINSAAADILSCSPSDREKPLQDIISSLSIETPDGRPLKAEEVPWLRALRGEVVREMKLLIHCPSHNKHVWVSTSASPIRTGDGRVRGAVAVLTDISVRPRA